MIYSRIRYYVCCDKCGKTIETNAADEEIAAQTAKREGWQCSTMLSLKGTYHKPKYVNLCPKCKEKIVMTRKEIVLKAISEVVSGCDPKRFAESNQTLYKVALKVAELCTKSFLPSNLDEAAEEYEMSIGSQDYCYLDIADAFKAGAEWMAEQGETFNGFVSARGNKRSLIAIEGSYQNFKFGKEVIVQIRKKEE